MNARRTKRSTTAVGHHLCTVQGCDWKITRSARRAGHMRTDAIQQRDWRSPVQGNRDAAAENRRLNRTTVEDGLPHHAGSAVKTRYSPKPIGTLPRTPLSQTVEPHLGAHYFWRVHFKTLTIREKTRSRCKKTWLPIRTEIILNRLRNIVTYKSDFSAYLFQILSKMRNLLILERCSFLLISFFYSTGKTLRV